MNTGLHKILLVEDDHSLGYVLKEYLAMSGYEVTWAKDGEEALGIIRKSSFSLCILDVMLPKVDGFSLASELKRHAAAQPFIFLTAKSLKIDKLKGFKLGADDYISKPVDEEELLARIGAVISRTTKVKSYEREISIGNFQFDLVNSSLTYDGKTQTISKREADVLKVLSSSPGKLVERKQILIDFWGTNDYFTRRSMDVIISRLRKYLKNDLAITIVNVHSRGFILKIDHTHEGLHK